MGFSYQGRKLCCDACPVAGARKHKCPFGYCPSTAFCPTCWDKYKKGWKEAHRTQGCEKRHAEYMAKEAEKLALIEACKYD